MDNNKENEKVLADLYLRLFTDCNKFKRERNNINVNCLEFYNKYKFHMENADTKTQIHIQDKL